MFKWKEVYKTYNYEHYVSIANLLTHNDIMIKTKVSDSRNRMTSDVILGGSPVVLNDGGGKSLNTEYCIKVLFICHGNMLTLIKNT